MFDLPKPECILKAEMALGKLYFIIVDHRV